jgi:PAS domain S-box-containing protein
MLVYTALLITTLSLSPDTTEPFSSVSLMGPAAGVICLFFVVLFLLISIFNADRNKIRQLEKRLLNAKADHAQTRHDHEQIIEKRIFEIAVVNASLNREIGERNQAETKSRELHKQMELILNSAGEGIFGLDTKGLVTFVNTAASVMTGFDIDDLIGQSHHELVHHSHADGKPHDKKDCLISQAYLDGIVHFSSDDVFWTQDGSSFPVEYVSTPIIDNAIIRGAVVVFRDQSTFT